MYILYFVLYYISGKYFIFYCTLEVHIVLFTVLHLRYLFYLVLYYISGTYCTFYFTTPQMYILYFSDDSVSTFCSNCFHGLRFSFLLPSSFRVCLLHWESPWWENWFILFCRARIYL